MRHAVNVAGTLELIIKLALSYIAKGGQTGVRKIVGKDAGKRVMTIWGWYAATLSNGMKLVLESGSERYPNAAETMVSDSDMHTSTQTWVRFTVGLTNGFPAGITATVLLEHECFERARRLPASATDGIEIPEDIATAKIFIKGTSDVVLGAEIINAVFSFLKIKHEKVTADILQPNYGSRRLARDGYHHFPVWLKKGQNMLKLSVRRCKSAVATLIRFDDASLERIAARNDTLSATARNILKARRRYDRMGR